MANEKSHEIQISKSINKVFVLLLLLLLFGTQPCPFAYVLSVATKTRVEKLLRRSFSLCSQECLLSGSLQTKFADPCLRTLSHPYRSFLNRDRD